MAIEIFRYKFEHHRKDPKREHYALLCDLSWMVKDVIDAGTFMGLSAHCLASNKNARITSYDIDDSHLREEWISHNNIVFKKMPVLDDLDHVLKSDFIFLDIDPHDGIQEKVFSDKLIENKYTGVVLCDDIYLKQAMFDWWKSLPGIRIDLTDIGHFSGTGLWIPESSTQTVKII